VSKVTWAVLIGLFAGGTYFAVFDYTKASIKYTVGNGLAALMSLFSIYFYDGALQYVIWVCDAKLNTYNCISHIYYLLSLCLDYSVLKIPEFYCQIPELIVQHKFVNEFFFVFRFERFD